MVMDMSFVDVGADNKSVITLGKAAGQLTAQAVGLLRGDLARDKRLPDGVGNHIVSSVPSAGLGLVLLFGKKKLCVSNPAVTLETGYQSTAVRFFWILYIVDNITDRFFYGPAFASMQRHNACGCDIEALPSSRKTVHEYGPLFVLNLPHSVLPSPHP